MELVHIVSPEEDSLTLQQILRGRMGLSGREVRHAKQTEGGVTVDDAPFFSNQRVSAGMTVRVLLDDYDATSGVCSNAAGSLPGIEVVYEDDALLCVFKPALLQCHPSPSAPRGSDTLEARVGAYLGRAAHPVHRLDSETTGLVLFAKLPFAQSHLQMQMQRGTFQKTYEAWASGLPSPESGEIDAPIRPEAPDSFTRIVAPDGQHAVSRYAVLESLRVGDDAISRLRLSPVTGRTHQLRVHMAHIGCPLLGDTRYCTPSSRRTSDALGLSFHQLSAVSLSFIHPITGTMMTLQRCAAFTFEPQKLANSR